MATGLAFLLPVGKIRTIRIYPRTTHTPLFSNVYIFQARVPLFTLFILSSFSRFFLTFTLLSLFSHLHPSLAFSHLHPSSHLHTFLASIISTLPFPPQIFFIAILFSLSFPSLSHISSIISAPISPIDFQSTFIVTYHRPYVPSFAG